MKKLKITIIAGALSMMVAMPALANNTSISPLAAPAQFMEADIESLFEQDAGSVQSVSPVELAADDMEALFEEGAEPMELAMLSPEEMQETEGAIIWNGVIGGGIGLGWYLITTPSNQWSLGGAALNTAIGVATSYGAGSLVKVIGPYKSGGWGIAVNKGLYNPFTLQKNAQQAARFNFRGVKPTTTHHRFNGTGFNKHSTYRSFSRRGR
uniref:Uncharacterized protein n=1 Tax=Candidatus Kentrum sp. LFY TaxID=2126342 RepID=A0A450URV7_9GAMM|nr:MAG: hypothetical protein BECKLFY1418A_GA0070994_104719 [Candidatus Kentron sp. LFY]